jgi:hypothetical protein
MKETKGARDRVTMTQVLGHKRPGMDPDLCKGQQGEEPGNCCWCQRRALVQQAETRVTQLATKSTSREGQGRSQVLGLGIKSGLSIRYVAQGS